jgi:class 3 adenylate cyclase/tetratricopeptide (TPR) repeat protein
VTVEPFFGNYAFPNVAACANCGTENRAGRRFCSRCGAGLSQACAACGAANEPGDAFCGDCGTPLGGETPPRPAVAEPPRAAATAERRLVSVLFADLVGFTTLAESRDSEEVRELLSRYFESSRRLIELYGGTVEKFIGDAVMAVWGTPVAQEDDAERAVRTALDLVAAVSALGDEIGAPGLRARAGVLTGEAAVNLGAIGEGMVAGDLVNTAARIQAEAEPGIVLVGQATRRAAEAAVVFEAAGEHVLKGKAEPVQLYRAVRVAAARGGALRSMGLEAPFVGREPELRLVKELFHASAEQSRPQLVSIVGIGGIGKSRLAWEFFKYIDGLKEEVMWHRGRCLAYGEGVAYWALAEMVRTRARILEADDPAGAREKLAACLVEHLPDPEERDWVAPRLANLLGLEERADVDRQDLFAAWRLFFERLADEDPVVLVFEDLQWADPALLAFVDYLLEWSAGQRLYVLALARPELGSQNPEFARGVRNAATLALEPLPEATMAQLLDGYVPGLPAELRQQVLDRAQGVPLYAVETVRMLVDRGLLVEEQSVYRLTGEIRTLEVPETLHALAAARLDGLTPEERRLVQDGCVLGKTFTRAALSALAGLSELELDPLLSSLVRKEVLSFQADPRQPERGQYGFLQELLREVAYETLARRDRKERHLAAVAALNGLEHDAPEVVATHLLAAYRLAPDDDDAVELRARAAEALERAADRAASLAAPEEAQRYLDQAAELVDGPEQSAALLARAGRFAAQAGQPAQAREQFDAAIGLYERLGDAHAVARVGVALADVDVSEGRLEQAERRLEAAVATLEQAGPTEELAATLAELGRMKLLRGERTQAAATVERALRLAETLLTEETLVHALNSRALLLIWEERPVEGVLLLEGALRRARDANLYDAWRRVANNLMVFKVDRGLYAEAVELAAEIEARARQRGDRELLAGARFGPLAALIGLGRWQEALGRIEEADSLQGSSWSRYDLAEAIPLLCELGELARAQAMLDSLTSETATEQADAVAAFLGVTARLLRAQGRPGEALPVAEQALAYRSELGIGTSPVRRALGEAIQAAIQLDDLDKAESLLASVETLKPGQLNSLVRADAARFRALLCARRGEHAQADETARTAEAMFRELDLPFGLAVTQLEHAEWLVESGRGEEAQPLLAEARDTFARLEARPWLERLAASASDAQIAAAAGPL